jgi:hypothetical protein
MVVVVEGLGEVGNDERISRFFPRLYLLQQCSGEGAMSNLYIILFFNVYII